MEKKWRQSKTEILREIEWKGRDGWEGGWGGREGWGREKESGRESRGTSARYGPPLGGLPVVQSALRTGVASLLVGDLSRSQPRADNRVVHVAGSMRERRVLRGNNNKEIVTGAAIVSERYRQHRAEQEWFRLFRLNWRAKTKDRRSQSRCRFVSWVFERVTYTWSEGRRIRDSREKKEEVTQRGPERVLNSNCCACLKPRSEIFHLTKLCLRPWGKCMYIFLYIFLSFIRFVTMIFSQTFIFLLCPLQDVKSVTLREIFVHFRNL